MKTISEFVCWVLSQSRLRRASSPKGRAKFTLSVGFAASSPKGRARFALSVGFAASSPSGGARFALSVGSAASSPSGGAKGDVCFLRMHS